MRKRLMIAAVFVGAVVCLAVWFTPEKPEGERLVAEAERMVRNIKLIRNKAWNNSPRLMIEMAMLKGKKEDPMDHFDDRFDAAMARLQELGVVQERKFLILNTNGAPAKVDVMGMFERDDVLWMVTGPWTNGVFEVRARAGAMVAWEQLERDNAGRRAGR